MKMSGGFILLFFCLFRMSVLAGGTVSDTSKAAYIIGITADSGVDLDSNGFYNALSISIETEIVFAGYYTLTAMLTNAHGGIISYRENANSAMPLNLHSCECDSGIHRFSFLFSGQDIYKCKIDGNYLVALSLLDSIGTVLDSKICTTSRYDHRSFREWLDTTGEATDQ